MAIDSTDIDFDATEAFHSESPDAGLNIDFEATERYYRQPFQYDTPPEADSVDTAIIIGSEVVPTLLLAIPFGIPGAVAGSALGNYFSQQYRIGRGLQDDVGLGELGAATALAAVPLGRFAKTGLAGKTAIRGAEGAGLATGELLARTHLDEGRAPTRDEIATTLLFGGAFGGAMGAAEAKWFSDLTGVNAKQGTSRPEAIKLLENKLPESGGPENFAVDKSRLDPFRPAAWKSNADFAEKLMANVEGQLLLEAEGTVNRLARQRGEEAVGVMADIQKGLDDQMVMDDSVFSFGRRQSELGFRRIHDETRLNEIGEQVAKLDHKLGAGEGAKKERARLAKERTAILKRNKMTQADFLPALPTQLDDLQTTIRGRQVTRPIDPLPPGNQILRGPDQMLSRRVSPLKDRPMEQAGKPDKHEALAEKYFGQNYEKLFAGAMASGASGAAAISMLSEDDRNELSRAGLSPLLIMGLIGMGLGPAAFRKFRKTAGFKRANAAARAKPEKMESDAVRASRIDAELERNPFAPPGWSKRIGRGMKESIGDALQPMSRTLKNIDSTLASVFRRHDKDILTRTREYMDRVSPFLVNVTARLKNRPELSEDFKLHLLNGDYREVVKVLDKTNAPDSLYKELKQMQDTLGELRDYARERGALDVGYLEDYFPRKIKDYKSFRKAMESEEGWAPVKNEIDAALDEYKSKHNVSTLGDAEAAEITSRVLRGYPVDPSAMKPTFTKQRQIGRIADRRMLAAYADPVDAAREYVERIVTATEKNHFLRPRPAATGKVVGFEGSKDRIGADLGTSMQVDESLAGAVASRLGRENNLSQEDIEKLRDVVQARFSGATVPEWIGEVKNIGYIQTMGNFGAAITQLAEMAYSAHFYGMGNTFRTLFNRKDNFDFVKHFNLKDHDIDAVTSGGGLSKALDKVFTGVGLKKLDQLSKNTIMNASWRKYRSQAMKDSVGLRDELTSVFGRERAGKMVEELKASAPGKGRPSDAVEELIFYKFLDLNPATLTEMPKLYALGSKARILYMLKTFMIKQFDVFREAGIQDILKAKKLHSEGKREEALKLGSKGVKGLAGLALVFAAANAGTDVIKDTLYGRPVKEDELFWNNVLKLFGLSRYLVYKAKRQGPIKSLIEFALPPTAVFDRGWQDLTAIAGDKPYKGSMLQGTPLDMVYWRYLGGVEKVKRLERED